MNSKRKLNQIFKFWKIFEISYLKRKIILPYHMVLLENFSNISANYHTVRDYYILVKNQTEKENDDITVQSHSLQ